MVTMSYLFIYLWLVLQISYLPLEATNNSCHPALPPLANWGWGRSGVEARSSPSFCLVTRPVVYRQSPPHMATKPDDSFADAGVQRNVRDGDCQQNNQQLDGCSVGLQTGRYSNRLQPHYYNTPIRKLILCLPSQQSIIVPPLPGT